MSQSSGPGVPPGSTPGVAPPALILRDVVAKDAAGVKGAARGMLFGVSLDLGPTDVAIVGGIEDGTLALADVLIGRRRPDRGVVRVDGKDPFASPELRARIASIGLEPSLPSAGSVAASVAVATSAWAAPPRPDDLLGRFGLSSLSSRPLRSLPSSELRAVEIALAFSTPDPALVVAFEPFADVSLVGRARIEEELARCATRVPVLAFTSSPGDARRLGRSLVLHRGRFVRSNDAPTADLAPGQEAGLTIWIEHGARDVASELSKSQAATSIAFDETGHEGGGVLRASGRDADALALAIADAVRACSAIVTAIAEGSPGLAEVRAATEHELRAKQLSAQQARALEMQAHAQMLAMQRAHYAGPPQYSGPPRYAGPPQYSGPPHGGMQQHSVPQPGYGPPPPAPPAEQPIEAPIEPPVEPPKGGGA